jgi:CHAT domain-containing protein
MLELPIQQRRRLDELRAAIRLEQRAADALQGTARAAALEHLITLRQELLGLVKSSGGGERGPTLALAQARAVVASAGAVVVPIVTKIGTKILVVTAGPEAQAVTVIDLPKLTTDGLNALMRGNTMRGKAGGWLGAYNINYLPRDELERRWPEWLAAISDIGPELWNQLGAQLDAMLRDRGVKSGARIIWMPSGALGILPLGIAQDPASKRRLADNYEIAYAPSLEALTAAHSHVAEARAATLAAVINPTGDLAGTEKEGAMVASHFAIDARTILTANSATPQAVLAALKGKTHWHIASHGTFSWDDARRSALVLHDQAPLSVGTLLETDGLGRPRLVVLSACETGLYDIDRNPDEFVGLPGAFTALGAAGVLGTLWPVSDTATALLIAKFYELHMAEGLSPPTALARAQAWLRDATSDDLQLYARTAAEHGRLKDRHLVDIEHELSAEALAHSRNREIVQWITRGARSVTNSAHNGATEQLARPYAHPLFWAGFIHTGL